MKSSIHELASNLGRRKLKGLMRASNTNCLQNAERDLHNLFRDEGLCLPIRPVQLDLRGQSVAYMKLTTWFDFLLTKQPQLLFGGYGRDKCDLLLSTFWKLFEQTCPAHDVFQMHGREGGGRLSKCVPYYLHLDEGVSFIGVLADEAAELMEKGLVIGREKETWYPCFLVPLLHGCQGRSACIDPSGSPKSQLPELSQGQGDVLGMPGWL